MSHSIPPSDKTRKEMDETSFKSFQGREISESFVAKQILSEGPHLERAIPHFSRFIWFPSQFLKSSFILNKEE